MSSSSKINNILIIDDDETDRMAIKRTLAKSDPSMVVREASTGEEAAAILAQQCFDCIFLDYRLPDMDGVTFLQRFYDIGSELGPCPVVMLTGQGNEGIMIDALRWGVNDYIVKDHISRDTLMIATIKAREIFELRKNRIAGEEKLRHAQKMDAVGQLTSGIAHDFNNLLMVILGNTRLLRQRVVKLGAEAEALLGEKVADIDSAARKGSDLVRHLMVFTRQRELDPSVIDPNECIGETLTLLSRTLQNVELQRDLSPDIWSLQVDKGMLENAIINLAVNARDAMPQGGILRVTTEKAVVDNAQSKQHPELAPNDYVLISVTDNGTGMPESVSTRIFEPFYTTKPQGEGTGLGLAMAYGFAKQSGGGILVESEVGRGTTFRIYLPRHAEKDPQQEHLK